MSRQLLSFFLLMVASSCVRTSGQTWEDFKTAGRYVQKGVDSMWGKDYESRMLTSDEEFSGPREDEFIPLRETDLRGGELSDRPLPQPKGIPGSGGTPSLASFYFPPDALRAVFQSVHFNTDEHIVKEKLEVEGLLRLASFLKKNPNVFVVVEGNCDKRASADYNMALGMRRANHVRSFLVKQGINLNRIYPISRGKENPLALGDAPEDYRTNRRCEFKIYER